MVDRDSSESDTYDPRKWSAGAPTSVTKSNTPTNLGERTSIFGQHQFKVALLLSSGLLASGLMTAKLTSDGRVLVATSRTAGSPMATAIAGKTAQSQEPSLSRRILNLQRPSELRDALIANGISKADAEAASSAASEALSKSDHELHAAITLSQIGNVVRLDRVEASFLDSSGAVISRGADGRFVATPVAAALSTVVKVARGEMDENSFYSSAVTAGVTDSLVPDFAQAFAFDFDFQREIHPGDVFEAAFEQSVNAHGEVVGPPRLLFASLITATKSRALYVFQVHGQKPGWFDGNGRSIVRSLMRTPIAGARISSGFGWRLHPVLGFMKLHKGTDFAAPTGTPIYAAGAGVVMWAHMKGPNGNLCIIKHDNGWLTYYLHMNRYAPGITEGVRVAQGQQVGEVGTTGRSTGPHLHYEVHVNDEAVDPMSIKTDEGQTLSGDDLKAFFKERNRIDVARARYAG